MRRSGHLRKTPPRRSVSAYKGRPPTICPLGRRRRPSNTSAPPAAARFLASDRAPCLECLHPAELVTIRVDPRAIIRFVRGYIARLPELCARFHTRSLRPPFNSHMFFTCFRRGGRGRVPGESSVHDAVVPQIVRQMRQDVVNIRWQRKQQQRHRRQAQQQQQRRQQHRRRQQRRSGRRPRPTSSAPARTRSTSARLPAAACLSTRAVMICAALASGATATRAPALASPSKSRSQHPCLLACCR